MPASGPRARAIDAIIAGTPSASATSRTKPSRRPPSGPSWANSRSSAGAWIGTAARATSLLLAGRSWLVVNVAFSVAWVAVPAMRS